MQSRRLRLLSATILLAPMSVLAAPGVGWISALAPVQNGTLIAGQGGLFFVGPDGAVTQRAAREGGFTALAADRSSVGVIYASGSTGGLLRSSDTGRSWQTAGQAGPQSFAVLASGPKVLYGVADALYQSLDGGQNWSRSGMPPDKLISLTVSAKDPTRLLAGTETGLLTSADAGAHWQPTANDAASTAPITLISSEGNGTLWRFGWGPGLQRASAAKMRWTSVNNQFGGQVILQMVRQGKSLVASTNLAKLFVSRDEGQHWKPLAGYPKPTTVAARTGEKLFTANCQVCHGDHGIGQSPQLGTQQTLAPALDETAHAWHHSDEQLEQTILNGLPAPSLMVGWNGRLKPSEAKNIVAYIKSLWTEKALRCQGPKHMDPDCQS